MNEQEARRLAARIDNEPGWHAEVERNDWTGQHHVRAWQGEGEDAEEDSYTFHYRGQWYNLGAALRAEESH